MSDEITQKKEIDCPRCTGYAGIGQMPDDCQGDTILVECTLCKGKGKIYR